MDFISLLEFNGNFTELNRVKISFDFVYFLFKKGLTELNRASFQELKRFRIRNSQIRRVS